MTCRSSFRNYYPATIGLSSTSHGFDLNVVDIDYSKGLLGLNSASNCKPIYRMVPKEEVNSDYVGLENNGSNNGRFEKRLEGHVALLV